MRRVVCLFWVVLSCLPVVSAQTPSPPSTTVTLTTRTAGLVRHEGFFPYFWDEKKGDILFELSPAQMSRQFLYFAGLGSGTGSTEIFADRSTLGNSTVCRVQRVGSHVLLIQENTNFRAENGSHELKHSVAESFPVSVLASLPIEAEQDGVLLVNASPLLIHDSADLLAQLRRPSSVVGGTVVRDAAAKLTDWRLDPARSAIDLDDSGSFPLNTEIEVLLTFTTDSESNLNQPNPHVLSLREHHSFVALPEGRYETREQDLRVGFINLTFDDFSQPYDRPLERYLITRWRLQKKNPTAALSEPVKPIVFYLDRAIPEPVRSAAREGALWWNVAFEQAGFKNALRIEDLPEGANPMDIRYSTIQWTNRSGRGWSVGQTQIDPRTGEILHAVVQLDSHRMRTANNYWQVTMPSGRDTSEPSIDLFAALDPLDPSLTDEQVMVKRLALLTCHEVGHAIGLEHNFVASTFDRGSVMDYFAPRIRIRQDGSADLTDAYMRGVGSYDRFAIEWGYSEGVPNATSQQEQARLDSIVRSSIAKGVVWGNYLDPLWNAYDDGPDPVTWLKEVLPVREALLARYGENMVRPGEPTSVLASRFALVYLFHRYALAAAVNVVGGAKIPLSLAGDGQAIISVWPAESQKEALRLLVSALEPARLEVPAKLWGLLGPSENRDPDPERFASSAGYLFNAADGARAVTEVVAGGLLQPQRLERLFVLAGQQASVPSPAGVISALVNAAFADSSKTPAQVGLQNVVQTDIAERLMILAANPTATPEVRGVALEGVQEAQKATQKSLPGNSRTSALENLDREIKLFLENPQQNTPKLGSSGAPPGPPV
jgi:Met-zincin/Domain of unknown function (DUF5117)